MRCVALPGCAFPDDVRMDHLVDLDDVASQLSSVLVKWRNSATVGPLTWRDAAAPWPQPIVSVRGSVVIPESVGLRLQRDDDEMQVVVWAGGWADVDIVRDGEARSICPEFTDAAGAYAAVVRRVDEFLA